MKFKPKAKVRVIKPSGWDHQTFKGATGEIIAVCAPWRRVKMDATGHKLLFHESELEGMA